MTQGPSPVQHRVLLVGSSLVALDNVAAVLQELPAEVCVALDGRQAWQLFTQNPPDLVVVDENARGLSAVELTQMVRAHARACATPVVLLSQHATSKAAERELEMVHGVDAVVGKPVVKHTLLVKLSGLLPMTPTLQAPVPVFGMETTRSGMDVGASAQVSWAAALDPAQQGPSSADTHQGAQPVTLGPLPVTPVDLVSDMVLVVTAGQHQGRELPLVPNTLITVGRDPECTLCLHDERISRHHLSIHRRGATVYLEDQGSTNGTFVNGVRVESAVLRPSDRVLAGTSVLCLTANPLLRPVRDDVDVTPRKDSQLKGSLDRMPLRDVLRLLGTLHRTGQVVITARGFSGVVEVVQGRPCGATLPGHPHVGPEQAFKRLLELSRGEFEFRATQPLPPVQRPHAAH